MKPGNRLDTSAPPGDRQPASKRETVTDVRYDAIVGAFGLPPGKNFISVKGDPSLRETVPLRPRQESRIDRRADEVLETCAWLLRKTGCYSIYIGFNSSEVRTESVFNPFNYEMHDAEALLDPGYLQRHFVRLPYRVKMTAIQKARRLVHNGQFRRHLPEHWRMLLDRKRREWQPVDKKLIPGIMQAFNRLRQIEGFYLRYAALSLSQNIVRASFNCDGTYVIAPEHFPRFVEEMVP